MRSSPLRYHTTVSHHCRCNIRYSLSLSLSLTHTHTHTFILKPEMLTFIFGVKTLTSGVNCCVILLEH
ncbi:hypothetical protein ACSBR2_004662 [Camellia fascicularis]